MNASIFRKTWRLPICMPPLFMLENEEQWYPPGFLVFCALLPQRWLQQKYWLLNHLVDLGTALLIYFTILWTGADVLFAAVAMLLYAIVSGLVLEFSALNVRPFGLLLFNIVMLLAFATRHEPVMALALGLFATLLFFSHKLSIQQLWFTLPLLSLVTGEWIWIMTLGMIYTIPFVLWPRGAWRILQGHAVIVRFWHRNWHNLGAHQVRQSPVLGDSKTQTDFYADESPASAARFLKNALHQNYFVLPVMMALVTGSSWINSQTGLFLITWIISVYIWAAAIHFIRPLRGIGLGQQYLKFGLVPGLAGTALCFSGHENPWVWGTGILAIILTCRQYWLVARNVWQQGRAATGNAADTDLDQILDMLSRDNEAKTLCLPVHLCDLVVYKTRKPVYWGTHSDIFDDRLEAFFPVMKYPLAHYARDGVNRLLLDTRYAGTEELGLNKKYLIDCSGPFSLFRLEADRKTGTDN